MPFQPVDFSRFPIIPMTGISNFLENLGQGQKLAQLPEMLKQQLAQGEADVQAKQMANAKSGMDIEQAILTNPLDVKAKKLANALSEAQRAQYGETTKAKQLENAQNAIQLLRMQQVSQLLSGNKSPSMERQTSIDQSHPLVQALSQIPGLQVPGNEQSQTLAPLGQSSGAPQSSGITQPMGIPSQGQSYISPQGRKVTVLNPGNPQGSDADKAYIDNPQLRDQFDKLSGSYRKHTLNPETGQAFIETKYPSGKVEIESTDIGKGPGQIAREKEREKGIADTQTGIDEDHGKLSMQSANLQRMRELVNKNPNFFDVVGPINKSETKLFGSAADRDLFGQIANQSGNVLMDLMRQFKGTNTGKEIGVAGEIKPNPGDVADIFLGKLNSMSVMVDLYKQRLALKSKLIDEGYRPIAADNIIEKEIPFAPVEAKIKEEMKNAYFNSALRESHIDPKNIKGPDEFKLAVAKLSAEKRKSLLEQIEKL